MYQPKPSVGKGVKDQRPDSSAPPIHQQISENPHTPWPLVRINFKGSCRVREQNVLQISNARGRHPPYICLICTMDTSGNSLNINKPEREKGLQDTCQSSRESSREERVESQACPTGLPSSALFSSLSGSRKLLAPNHLLLQLCH